MSLSDREAPPISRPEILCREIWQECAARSYAGILADFEAARLSGLTGEEREEYARLTLRVQDSIRDILQ